MQQISNEGKIKISELKPHPQNNYYFDEISDKDLRRLQWTQLKNDISTKDIQLCKLAQQIYNASIDLNAPIYQIRNYNDYLNYSKSNFHGGCNDNFNTKYENLFFKIFPYLQKQIPFGTGTGGYKKYGVKRYIADFVDPISDTIIEIDGNNHNNHLQKLKDELRELFFWNNGYFTIRFTNKEVLNLFRLHCNVIAMEIENE